MLLGGAIAGFFGGLTGLQGAMRSAFLMGTELEPEEYIATSASCSTIIDLARVAVYTQQCYLLRGITFIPQLQSLLRQLQS